MIEHKITSPDNTATPATSIPSQQLGNGLRCGVYVGAVCVLMSTLSAASAAPQTTVAQVTVAEISVQSRVARTENSPLQSLQPESRLAHKTHKNSAQNKKDTVQTPAPEKAVAAPASPSLAQVELPISRITNATRLAAAPTETEGAANDVKQTETTPEPVRIAASADETPAKPDQAEPQPLIGTIDYGQTQSAASSEKSGDEKETKKDNVKKDNVKKDNAKKDGTKKDGTKKDGKAERTPTAPATNPRLYAPKISYDGGTIIAEGDEQNPVRLESGDSRIIAQQVRVDTDAKTVTAKGKVRVERQVTAKRFSTFREDPEEEFKKETITETLQGENFEFNYDTREGRLDKTRVRLATFNIEASSLVINGQKYILSDVILRPGGLSDEELRIYGTPPFSIKARTVIIDTEKPAPRAHVAGESDTGPQDADVQNFRARTLVKGAGLYFKNLRLLPIPSTFLNRTITSQREQPVYQLTPRIYYNTADGVLITTRLNYPLNHTNPDKLSLDADIGVSTKVGFRGGLQLDSENRLGRFKLGARVNDVVTAQLTNRIELDRLPEFGYQPPSVKLFNLPGKRKAGLKFDFTAGNYRERFTDAGTNVSGSRVQSSVLFTTRMGNELGPYFNLFGRIAQYSNNSEDLRTGGFEVGYVGKITDRLGGQFSYTNTGISGSTPFRFDEVTIKQELRATFDVLLSPRYIIPIDLRYDLNEGDLRDATYGILRNYKTFAYGVSYQTSRRELRLELRQGF